MGGSETIYLLLDVDDIVLTAFNTELLWHTSSALQREFSMNDLWHFTTSWASPSSASLSVYSKVSDTRQWRLLSEQAWLIPNLAPL
jgi:hypothetical protein